jgi:serpin B
MLIFLGNWLKQFNPSDTIEDTFFNNGMNGTQVKMMSIRNKLWSYTRTHHLNSQFLEMPYSNKDFSLIIILPQHRNGLSKLKRIIKGRYLISAINSMNSVKVDAYLPKFKIEQNYNLKSALSKSPQFKKILNELDLSRINGQKNLIVSEVVHKVVIEVNEKGSEAAAATGVGVLSRSLPEVFRADHPFLYAIRDRRNNLILFLGQINQFNTYTKQKDSILRSRVMSFSLRDEDEDDEDYEF